MGEAPLGQSIEIAIPFFGSVERFKDAVLSVRAQTEDEWQLLVVADGPDVPHVEKWLSELGDHRIRFHRNSKNLGVTGNFQRCLELARGTHLVLLGCDDLLLPSYVRSVRRTLTRFPSAEAIQPGVEVINAEGVRVNPVTDRVKRLLAPRGRGVVTLSGESLMVSLMRGNWTYFPSICWRRDQLAQFGFRQDLHVTPDLALLAELVLHGAVLVVSPEVVFRYRRHRSSVSAMTARGADRFDEETHLFRDLASECRMHGWPRAARAARVHATSRLHAAIHVVGAVAARDGQTALRLLRNVVAA